MSTLLFFVVFVILVIAETIFFNHFCTEEGTLKISFFQNHKIRLSFCFLCVCSMATLWIAIKVLNVTSIGKVVFLGLLTFCLATQTVLCFEDLLEKQLLEAYQIACILPCLLVTFGLWVAYPCSYHLFIPVTFCLFTIKTRGEGDTESMLLQTFLWYDLVALLDTALLSDFWILPIVSFFVGYLIQFLLHAVKIIKTYSIDGIRHFFQLFQEKEPLPFLPALHVGFCLVLYFWLF